MSSSSVAAGRPAWSSVQSVRMARPTTAPVASSSAASPPSAPAPYTEENDEQLAREIADPDALVLHRWLLTFRNAATGEALVALTESFNRRNARRFLRPLRVTTIIFFLANILLIGYDFTRFGRGNTFYYLLALRLGGMLPLCISVVAYTFNAAYETHSYLLAIPLCLLGGCLVAYSNLGQSPGYRLIALLFVYMFSFSPLSVWLSLLDALIVIVAYTVVLGNTIPEWRNLNTTLDGTATNPQVQLVNNVGVLAAFILICGFIAHNLEFSLKQAYLDELRLRGDTVRLKAERALSNALIATMLPPAVALQLQSGRTTIADSVPEVTVLFCELQLNTQAYPPRTVVAVLNAVYSAFDALIDTTGVHKIETVGEVYLCVGGCPTQTPLHAVHAVEMALGMFEAMPAVRDAVEAQTGVSRDEINIRVGLNSGPVAAGIVGVKNPRYKLIGDTVNTASRMESTCPHGRIQMSASCHAALQREAPGEYALVDRGSIAVKGKGSMYTYWLTGRTGQPAIIDVSADAHTTPAPVAPAPAADATPVSPPSPPPVAAPASATPSSTLAAASVKVHNNSGYSLATAPLPANFRMSTSTADAATTAANTAGAAGTFRVSTAGNASAPAPVLTAAALVADGGTSGSASTSAAMALVVQRVRAAQNRRAARNTGVRRSVSIAPDASTQVSAAMASTDGPPSSRGDAILSVDIDVTDAAQPPPPPGIRSRGPGPKTFVDSSSRRVSAVQPSASLATFSGHVGDRKDSLDVQGVEEDGDSDDESVASEAAEVARDAALIAYFDTINDERTDKRHGSRRGRDALAAMEAVGIEVDLTDARVSSHNIPIPMRTGTLAPSGWMALRRESMRLDASAVGREGSQDRSRLPPRGFGASTRNSIVSSMADVSQPANGMPGASPALERGTSDGLPVTHPRMGADLRHLQSAVAMAGGSHRISATGPRTPVTGKDSGASVSDSPAVLLSGGHVVVDHAGAADDGSMALDTAAAAQRRIGSLASPLSSVPEELSARGDGAHTTRAVAPGPAAPSDVTTSPRQGAHGDVTAGDAHSPPPRNGLVVVTATDVITTSRTSVTVPPSTRGNGAARSSLASPRARASPGRPPRRISFGATAADDTAVASAGGDADAGGNVEKTRDVKWEDRLTLFFNTPIMQGEAANFEYAFQRDAFPRWNKFIQTSVVLLIIVLILFTGADAFKYLGGNEHLWRTVALIRYAGLLPVLLAFLAVSHTRMYRERWAVTQSLSSLTVLAVGVVIIIISFLGGDPGYGVLALYIVYCANVSLIALAFRMIVLLALVISYIATAISVSANSSNAKTDAFFAVVYLLVFFLGEMCPVLMREVAVRQNYFRRFRIEIERRKLAEEQAKSTRLLENLMPPAIVPRLRAANRELIADTHDEVTILWTDMKGFTDFSATRSPLEIVAFLNAMFSTFDRILDKYGVRKIEVLGDAFFCCAGVPLPIEDHAERCANAALEMLMHMPILRRFAGAAIDMRVGIHTGPVIAGVVGLKDPRYHLFGDSVPMANAMESNGIPGRIHISSTTYAKLVSRQAERAAALASFLGTQPAPPSSPTHAAAQEYPQVHMALLDAFARTYQAHLASLQLPAAVPARASATEASGGRDSIVASTFFGRDRELNSGRGSLPGHSRRVLRIASVEGRSRKRRGSDVSGPVATYAPESGEGAYRGQLQLWQGFSFLGWDLMVNAVQGGFLYDCLPHVASTQELDLLNEGTPRPGAPAAGARADAVKSAAMSGSATGRVTSTDARGEARVSTTTLTHNLNLGGGSVRQLSGMASMPRTTSGGNTGGGTTARAYGRTVRDAAPPAAVVMCKQLNSEGFYIPADPLGLFGPGGGFFAFEERHITVKGRGEQTTYLLSRTDPPFDAALAARLREVQSGIDAWAVGHMSAMVQADAAAAAAAVAPPAVTVHPLVAAHPPPVRVTALESTAATAGLADTIATARTLVPPGVPSGVSTARNSLTLPFDAPSNGAASSAASPMREQSTGAGAQPLQVSVSATSLGPVKPPRRASAASGNAHDLDAPRPPSGLTTPLSVPGTSLDDDGFRPTPRT